MRRAACAAIVTALATACVARNEERVAAASAPAGDILRGRLVLAFERTSFTICEQEADCAGPAARSCWFSGSADVWKRIHALGELSGRDVAAMNRLEFRLAVRGSRRDAPDGTGFGHMAAWDCEIEASEVLEIERTR